MSNDKKIVEATLNISKETPGTYQYRDLKTQRPTGIRVLMLDRWLFDDKNDKPPRVKVTVERVA